jgi:DNA primase
VRFEPQFLDEVRARTSIVQLIGRTVKLIRAGHEWKACCPFHNEKTPSFTVNDDKGFYHCFGCGAHGDAIRFLTDARGLSFRDAVASLAAEAGLELPQETQEARARSVRTSELHEIHEKAAAEFARQLVGNAGSAARAYLERRGVGAEIARRFGLGFAPDGSNLARALQATMKPPPSEDRLVEAGLLIRTDDGRLYDRFRGRLMFAIRDQRGRVVGFGGRLLGPGEPKGNPGGTGSSGAPKYLNSPDTPLFDKGRLLYNFDQAAAGARRSGRLVVVEGYMDVIALAGAGLAETVAPLGTALTEEQLKLAWRAAPEPILCFDGDAAGRRAALKAATRALPLLEPGRSLRFAALPDGVDPDDLARQAGRQGVEQLLEGAEPLIDFLWRAETENADAGTPERRAALAERLRAHARAVGNPDIARLYAIEFRSRLDRLFAPPPAQPGPRRDRRGAALPPAGASSSLKTLATRGAGDAEVTAVLDGLLLHPTLAEDHAEAIAQLHIASARLCELRAAILDAAVTCAPLDMNALTNTLADRGLSALAAEVRRSNRLKFSFNRPDAGIDRASQDLASVVDALAARHHIEKELQRLRPAYESLDQSVIDRQRQLREAEAAVRERLVRLARSADAPAGDDQLSDRVAGEAH